MQPSIPHLLATSILLATAAASVAAQAPDQAQHQVQVPDRDPIGKPAPAWPVAEWFQLEAGHDSLQLADLRGKVVYLYRFQSLVPRLPHARLPDAPEAGRALPEGP